jgi:hypothetical protein
MRSTLLLVNDTPTTNRIAYAIDAIIYHAYFDVLMQIWQLRDMTYTEVEYDGELPEDWHNYSYVDGAFVRAQGTQFERAVWANNAKEAAAAVDARLNHHKAHIRIIALSGLPTTAIGIVKLQILNDLAIAYLDPEASQASKSKFEAAAAVYAYDSDYDFIAREIIARNAYTKAVYNNLVTRGFKF